MANVDYKAAYERQKKAREIAEDLLENRSRELYEANKSLQYAYNKLKGQKEKIVHQEKLASLGQLCAGLAHEINNPAGYIKSNLNTLRNYSEELTVFFKVLDDILSAHKIDNIQVPIVELIEIIQTLRKDCEVNYLLDDIKSIASESREGISRIESIVKGLRDFSRPDEAEPDILDVVQCIENTLSLVKMKIKDKLYVCYDYADPLYVKGQQGSLSQVFLNLIINALHAVGDNGRLIIKAKKETEFAVISFIDNGCGMGSDVCEKIFEPFFTTKKNGQGTGLGLSISHGIIKTHGGLLSVESVEGQGTCFIVKLPLSEADD
ncbi:sensor histidine kinase [Marinagarivorans algicola]|uniref:sensor histidine kinase n=1 Tax=Marinagarivorans algicola TaxID=1513270 RepID=UPI0006B8B2EF|nr:ATP-binding protein [Marinagarivorans algicola]